MPYNGNGVFSTVYDWPTDKANGIKIRADRMQGQDDDMANGLSNCITRDGQSPAEANLPMGTYKHTGVGAATSADEYLRADQAQNNGVTYVTTTGDGNAYVITPTPAATALTAGQAWDVRFHTVNLGTTPTIQVSGLTVTTMTKQGATALIPGDIQAGSIKRIQYDGTNFQVSNTFIPTAATSGGSVLSLTQSGTGQALTVTSTPGLGRGIIADGINRLDVLLENVTTTGQSVEGTINVGIAAGYNALYFTQTAKANPLLNIRGGTFAGGTVLGLNSILGLNSSNAVSLSVLLQNGVSAVFMDKLQIDGSIVTVAWQGQTAPAAGNASSLDLYHLWIVKTANAQYRVLASQSQFR